MTKSKIFQYIVFWNPTENEIKEGLKAKIIVEQKTVLSESIESANIMASRDIPEEYINCLDQCDIAIRPF